MKSIGACCALMICSTARSCAFTLHISLKFSAAADHTDGVHSQLDHCMHAQRRSQGGAEGAQAPP